ncbi:MAG TPA: hypothetical protein VFJ14_04430 [Nocardioidaceae bacterium]|nr:hypothetical protein [Nocardioidaceae bacterium]
MKLGSGTRRATAVLTATLTGAAAATALLGAAPATASAQPQSQAQARTANGGCVLGKRGAVKHVIYVQFDNTHLRRDMPNVPSDLEQMPHLLNFMKRNGTLLSNDHTVLISHTAGGILSSLTGVYPDRHGQTVSNSYVRYNGDGFDFKSSFGYWTDPVAPGVPNMVTADGTNPPAPWVPFTRSGCDVGEVATANTVLENTGTGPTGDMTAVFGEGSPQWQEASDDAAVDPKVDAKTHAKPQADFVGFAVHCARRSTTCANGQTDALPEEPGGYAGYQGLFGAQEIDPLLTGQDASVPVTDLAGNPVTDPYGNPGFPGFDGMSAAVSLAYSAKMQEAGIPVTYAYISDAHDFHGTSGNAHEAYGPGSQGYVDQLKAYDEAFAAFFKRLRHDGINQHNTLFVFTVDEGDPFVGSTPNNPGCDGVTVPCDWSGHIGEINSNIDTLMANQHPEITTKFTVHGDDAPTFYLSGNPGQNDPSTRAFERAVSGLTAVNPYTGNTDPLMVRMAGHAEMKLLHMYTTGDPDRNASFAFFGDPNYFLTDYPSDTCETCINSAYAWNHGDIQPEIANTWLGFVGPGVRNLGQTGKVWTDHTDVRPTMLDLLRLRDDYAHDGRAITQILDRAMAPRGLQTHARALRRLGAAYKQLDAPFGGLGRASLAVSTRALVSGTTGDDSYYEQTQHRLRSWLESRNHLANQIGSMLENAEFSGQPLDVRRAKALTRQARRLVGRVERAAG